MKVSDVGKVNNGIRSGAAAPDKPYAPNPGSSFSRQMSDLSKERYREYIEELKERIFEQGERIKKNADISEFIKYRKLIAELIGEAAGNAYSASRNPVFDGGGRHKVMITVRLVNAKLDEMARKILEDQKDNIDLVRMVDDIRGLLVDLFL